MIYHVIGTMSGSSMDGLDLVYCSLEEVAGKWKYTIHKADCIAFDNEWKQRLLHLQDISAKELLLTHTDFGHWMGNAIKQFITTNELEHKVHLVSSHGHTVFHEPTRHMTFQMGDGAAIAAINKLPVVSDLRNMDIALGGQGAPIVPIGEKLLWDSYSCFLNIGGICNITFSEDDQHKAFDVCPANRVLNLLVNESGKTFDQNGEEAATGKLNEDLLYELNELDYYKLPFPKSLSNEYGVDTIFRVVQKYDLPVRDKLFTYCIHIAQQIAIACPENTSTDPAKMLITGGGAFNTFLVKCITEKLATKNVEVVIPDADLVNYKEALVMALIGVLRWREQSNVMSSVTGALRNSVGGAVWMGQE